ncbi:hypothetical protein FSP39_008112 [Pinctada imbricata]|uniref:Uncharacterized protein n=1 Tax=Pinctada imbricata TaxID=66713 RepID=A0AA89BU89_PINIB|nr:hypothetical protein FSP39_008112 [Pinctada imbricata]
MEVDQRSDDFRPMTYRERLLRLRSQNVVAADHDVKADTETKLPRIVLKDSLGNRLNTFTLLQEALYRAEWNVKQSKESKLPEEWRLPGAPLPARPDYSRSTPSAFTPRHPRPKKKNDDGKVTSESSSSGKRFHEIDVDDVSFVKESLNHLPQVPSLAFLRQEFLRDRKDYLQIVGSILLHKRFLSETDKREAIYNFPGFCTGCQRSGLCYGCDRSSEPHYHVDGLKLGEAYQLNTNKGIGFLNEDRFTDNWRLRFPELTRRSRGRDGSKIPHDSQLFGEDSRGGRKGFAIISDEKLPDLPGLGPFKYDNDDQGSSEKDPDRMDIYNQQDLLSDLDKLSRHGTLSGEGQRGRGGTGRQGGQEGSEALQGDKTGEKILRLSTAGQDVDRESDEDERNNDKSTSVSSSQKRDYDKDSSTRREKSDMSSGHYSQHTSRWASGTEGYEEDDDEEDYTMRDSETMSSAQKRRRLYKAPAPFKLKQRKQRATQSRSPFSTNRKYDVPTGKPWSPKKSNKKLTEFAEFERKEGDWKEPKKFTIKHSDKGTTQFWSPPPGKDKDVKKKKTRRKVQGPPPSPDSGLESEKVHDPKRVPGRQRPISQEQTTSNSPDAESNQNIESEITVENDEQSPFQDVLDVDEDDDDDNDKDGGEDDDKEIVLDVPHPSPSTPMNEHGIEIAEKEEIIGDNSTPVGISPIVEKPQKKEKVKKPKKEVKKPPTPIRSCSPHTPIPLDEEPVVALETQKIDVAPPALPELPPLELPPLPEYVEDKEKKDKKKVPHRVSIEPMPKLQDQAPPPSKKSKPLQVPRSKPLLRKKSLAEAPVTVDEISHMKDPLDFLAKYCIISLDRLPYYEKVYNRVVASQPQRYEPPLSPISGMPLQPTKRREKKKEKGEVTLHDMVSVTRGMEPFKVGLNVPEQYVEKLIYTIQICDEKHLDISERLRELEIQKTILLAERAKQLNPDIAKVEFKLKKSKKKKKKKKSGAVEVEEPIVFSKKDITDEVIVARIDEKMMKKLMKEPDLHHIQCDMERCADRLATLEFRILQMENERNILDMYCTDLFFTEQLANERPVEFRRQQSNLFNKLHPDPDIEMNIEELERALHTINSTLLTESEFGYLFHVLNLAGRRKINFKLFSVIAALSEKISQMDPVIKDLLNKDDYNALDIKMERSKLFGLLDDGDTAMYGNALASNLAVELMAGGLTPEHTSYVISKFNREGKGFIDFLDYVMYVPLFIEIHERIISDPLNAKLVI